ncbi:MAG: cold-shock protein [Deltaproteobacteria bacterium]|nr:cold-shock protein [Deltaproteobacteria bacterium]
MAEGRVKWFNEKKGYGFIESETHGDVFVHYTGIDGQGFRTLRELERVVFEIEDSPKGPQAVNVKKI